jgi:hypothetical protein
MYYVSVSALETLSPISLSTSAACAAIMEWAAPGTVTGEALGMAPHRISSRDLRLGARLRLSPLWLEPRAQGGLARPLVPARSLEEGLALSPTHPLWRSISRMDQGIGLDFLQIVITFGTNSLYGRSVDFVNTWGSAAVSVS